MSAECFVDTNLLVYARDSSEPEKQPIAIGWLSQLWKQEKGRISTQVLNEYYVTVTQKLEPGLPVKQARSDVRALGIWNPVAMSSRLIEASWDIQDDYRYSWWDTLVITSALFLDCRYLLSEDMQHGQSIGALTLVNPFITPVDELL
jgi:predicted nucleic acid-binding protein